MKYLWLRSYLLIFITIIINVLSNNYTIAKPPKRQKQIDIPSNNNLKQNETSFSSTDWVSCQSLDGNYQEVYSFSTRNYYINICSEGENFFYYRQPKSNPKGAMLLKASIVFGGDVFQATKGKVTYFVGTNTDGYYSSVMQNNSEIVFEPEFVDRSTATNRGTTDSGNVSASLNTENPFSKQITLNPNEWKMCTQDKYDLHPRLNGWQEFIGEYSKTIKEYATINGHNVIDGENPKIETSDGLTITLNLGNSIKSVRSICVDSK